jgi:hypothetical protein
VTKFVCRFDDLRFFGNDRRGVGVSSDASNMWPKRRVCGYTVSVGACSMRCAIAVSMIRFDTATGRRRSGLLSEDWLSPSANFEALYGANGDVAIRPATDG